MRGPCIRRIFTTRCSSRRITVETARIRTTSRRSGRPTGPARTGLPSGRISATLFRTTGRICKRCPAEWKTAISPRLGLSFPITENSKLRFSYGHFNQRPSWVSLMGFPTSWYDAAPYATVRMDQWQGWYGHPGLSYDRTIQYEIGFTQSFFDFARLDLAAYYKDASRLTRFSYNGTYNRNGGGFASTGWGAGNSAGSTWSKTRNIANDGHDNIFYTNNGFKDIRGIEIVAEKLFTGRWSARGAFDFSTTTGGSAGYSQYREDGSTVNQPHSYEETKGTWLSQLYREGQRELRDAAEPGARRTGGHYRGHVPRILCGTSVHVLSDGLPGRPDAEQQTLVSAPPHGPDLQQAGFRREFPSVDWRGGVQPLQLQGQDPAEWRQSGALGRERRTCPKSRSRARTISGSSTTPSAIRAA